MTDDGDGVTWVGTLRVQIVDPRKESPGSQTSGGAGSVVPGRSETFVSYGVRAETDLPHFARTYMVTRKRFQDFAFLRNALVQDFPACIVPPLPDKHRLGYLTGDRFSAEFIQRRCAELQLFLERVCRHPTLQRAKIVQQFLESSEWHIDMHAYAGQSVVPSDEAAGGASSAPPGLLESMSDMVLNAFTRVRKPDPRFVAMKAELGVEEDRTAQCERILLRNRTHVSGMYETVTPFMELAMTHAYLSTDYNDLANAFEQLSVLESGMTAPMQRVAHALGEFAELESRFTFATTDDVLAYLHAMRGFTAQHMALLKHRDSKQLDFEGLTDYLHAAVTERDRLASLGSPSGAPVHGNVRGTGLRGYVRSAVDRVWGVDEEQARIERLGRLDQRIDQLQQAVTASHTQAQSFSAQVAQEHRVYELGRRRELHQMLTRYVDGHVEMNRHGVALFDELIAALESESV